MSAKMNRTMIGKPAIVLMAIGITTAAVACHGTVRSDATASGAGAEVTESNGRTKSVSITDPILNMRAYSMTIPANWIFDGAVVQGSSCATGPFPVFRMESPDGLTGVKNLPRLDWAWSESSKFTPKNNGDCLPYAREVSAAVILKYMEGILQVEHVKDEEIPNIESYRRNMAARNTPTFQSTGDMAKARVSYHINKIAIDERLVVTVGCTSNEVMMLGRQHTCSAFVGRYWAPQGKFSDDTYTLIGKSLVIDQQWNAQWQAVIVRQLQQMAQDSAHHVLGALEANGRQRTAEVNAFNQAQDMRQKQHEDFLVSMQHGTYISMRNTGDKMNARSAAADDWCDYALDQQKRLDPNTGRISKDSSAYTYTWINQSGDHLQTNNINQNPNGNGPETWTLQQNVR